MTEPVVMEVASGARDDAREVMLRRLHLRFDLLRSDAAVDLDGAVCIYRTCRRAAVTPRGMVDCISPPLPDDPAQPSSPVTPT